ncbi:hypothetical protein B0H10DRAFT_2007231, partial [Mycena sp. CBHHK59/15]
MKTLAGQLAFTFSVGRRLVSFLSFCQPLFCYPLRSLSFLSLRPPACSAPPVPPLPPVLPPHPPAARPPALPPFRPPR